MRSALAIASAISQAGLPAILAVFVAAALVIAVAGVRLTWRAEALARITGLGELLTGALLIGLVTSLSGLVTSVSAAAGGHASLAVSNALGGIAAQTLFLVVADLFYPHANLEHAAASESNLLQCAVLMVLLSLPLLAVGLPGLGGAIHPVSPMLLAVYLFGLRLVSGARQRPMWLPRQTRQTRPEAGEADAAADDKVTATWAAFAGLALIVAVAGWVLALAAARLSAAAGIDESVVGGVLTAITTSLPELVVAVAAVRRGFLALALGDILGGNAFDVLFLAASDLAFPGGTIYALLAPPDLFWLALSLTMVGFLLLGLLRRERHGVGNIGFEGGLVLLLYLGGVTALAFYGGSQ